MYPVIDVLSWCLRPEVPKEEQFDASVSRIYLQGGHGPWAGRDTAVPLLSSISAESSGFGKGLWSTMGINLQGVRKDAPVSLEALGKYLEYYVFVYCSTLRPW